MNNLIPTQSIEFNTSNLITQGNSVVNSVVNSLGMPREILPPDDQIDMALKLLPREINLISPELRDKFIAKAVIASSVGLFDGAIVYVWNCVISELRNRVNSFGMEMIAHISGDSKPEGFLDKIQDVDLLKLCHQLNIINDEGIFYLQQCREIRNNASVAHPSDINIDDRELINFISRCCKYGLSGETSVTGINIKSLNEILVGEPDSDVLAHFVNLLKTTFKSQQTLVYQILYSNYIDSTKSSTVRSNALKIAESAATIISENSEIIVALIEKHSKYLLSNEPDKRVNSAHFFEKIGQLSSLSDAEKIESIRKAINNLRVAHFGMNNFYNEPPFAERLKEITDQINPIPESVIDQFVKVNLDCYVGNSYGVSWAAASYCEQMLKNLTPKGIESLIEYLNSTSSLNFNQKTRIMELLNFHEHSGIPTPTQKINIQRLKTKFS